jgi:GT2 family glycosyltransferase
MNPKVLVFSPTYSGKDYIFKEFYQALVNIDYDNYDYLIIDNTDDNGAYQKQLQSQGYYHIHRVPRGGNSRQALVNAQNYARQYALDNHYDYVLSVESDLIVPSDIIKRFLAYDVPVVGALYYIGIEVKVPCVFFVTMKGLMKGTRLITLEEAKVFPNTGLRRVHGVGLGCTLIKREVLEKFTFWHDERFTDKHSDVYLFMELENAHIPVYCDTNITVPHYPSDWGLVKDR